MIQKQFILGLVVSGILSFFFLVAAINKLLGDVGISSVKDGAHSIKAITKVGKETIENVGGAISGVNLVFRKGIEISQRICGQPDSKLCMWLFGPSSDDYEYEQDSST
jgi:hypothetical protein